MYFPYYADKNLRSIDGCDVVASQPRIKTSNRGPSRTPSKATHLSDNACAFIVSLTFKENDVFEENALKGKESCLKRTFLTIYVDKNLYQIDVFAVVASQPHIKTSQMEPVRTSFKSTHPSDNWYMLRLSLTFNENDFFEENAEKVNESFFKRTFLTIHFRKSLTAVV